jgi:EmrB/QacA subfamily drug resistance transporter
MSAHPTPAATLATTRMSPRDRLTLVVLALAQAMLVIDVTVVNVALPRMSAELGFEPGLAGWAIAAYAVPFGGLLLLGGRLGDLVGTRRMLVIGIVVFTLASLVAALATEPIGLLAARAGQGVGAALLSPAALSTLVRRFDGPARTRALAVWGAVGGAGAAVGVLIGGLLTEGPGWRWIFYLNLPVGALIVIAIPLLVPAMKGIPGRADVAGAVVGTLGIASLIVAVSSIGRLDPALVVAAAVLGVALLVGFVLIERRAAHPLIRLELIRRRTVAAGSMLMFAATALLVGSFFLLSFLLQNGLDWSAAATGLAFLPIALAVILGAQGAGHLLSRIGPRRIATVGLLIAAAGFAGAAFLPGAAAIIAAASVASLGLGAVFVCASTTALTGVAHEESGAASGFLNTWHEFGAAIGVAALGAVVAVPARQPLPGFIAVGVAAIVVAALAVAVVPPGKPEGGAVGFSH